MLAQKFLRDLEKGTVRAAYRNKEKNWITDASVKQQILELYRASSMIEMSGYNYPGFTDKSLLPPRTFNIDDKVRMVPGGSAVRVGTHIGHNVVILPPSYVNIGAYVDEGTMIDSHVLVGSCAQIGKNVHLSTAVQIGGVLEPIGNMPVIIEDECFIGAGAILTEGILVRTRAVIAPGVHLSASVPIYDVINQTIIKGAIPEDAVVVPGTRPIVNTEWSIEHKLSLNCAVIIKYRDSQTSSAVALEAALRQSNRD